MGDRRELSTITVAAHTMLLTRAGGVAVHLTQPAGDEDGAQPAIPTRRRPTTSQRNIEPPADPDKLLREPRWASRTLCGIRWTLMAGSDPSGKSARACERRPRSFRPSSSQWSLGLSQR